MVVTRQTSQSHHGVHAHGPETMYEDIPQHPSPLQDQHPQRCGLWPGLPPLHPHHTS